jgi:hypothetical protein
VVAEFCNQIDDDVVMDVLRARHHSDRLAVHQFIPIRLALLPFEELFDGPPAMGWISHGFPFPTYAR